MRRTYRILLRFILLSPIALIIGHPASAREHPESSGPVPGVVRVKVEREYADPHSLQMIVAQAAVELGGAHVRPWLNRELLEFSARPYLHFSLGAEGTERTFEFPHESLGRIMTLQYDESVDPEKAAAFVAAIEGIEYAETVSNPMPAYTSNDPAVKSGQQWHHEIISTLSGWDVVRGKSSVILAVTDTGLEPEHEDLASAIWTNPGESGELKDNGVDDDGNGFVDDWWGWDFGGSDGVSPDNDPRVVDDPHGTHVAGIAGAAGDNNIGGAGVAWGVQLMAIKIGSDRLKPKLPHGYEGILYASAMGAHVINCSWGAPNSYSRAEQELVSYVRRNLGVLIVAAAGNNGVNQSYYPASYDDVISVASTRENDRKAGSSNYHPTVDLVAPGDFVWSTWSGNQYAVESGTSMAAPMVSATAALLIGHDPSLSTDEVEQAILATTDDISLVLGSQYDGLLGSGRLNVFRALSTYDEVEAAEITEMRVVDGDGDGYIEKGENVRLEFDVRNVLAPSPNVSVSVEPHTFGTVTVTAPTAQLGAMEHGASKTTPEDAFILTFPDQTTNDSKVKLWVRVSTSDHVARRLVELNVYQTWGTTALNDVLATFNSVGNVAYNGMDKDQGDGFYYDGRGSLVWHGGLLLGNGPESLADVVRRGQSALGTDEGFSMITPYRLEEHDDGTVEVGNARFRENEGLGIEVAMTTREYADDPNVLLVMYEFRNTGTADVTGLHAGLYVDWDLLTDGGFDQASLDQEYRLGFMRNSVSTDLTTGIALLSDQGLNYTAVNNASDGIQSDFNDGLKWTMLSSGLYRETSLVDIDASMMIGAGPFSIAAGGSEIVAFAYVMAGDHMALRGATDRARARYEEISGVPILASDDADLTIHPMPTSRYATIEFGEETAQPGTIRIHDMLGRSVLSREFGREKNLTLDLSPLADGMYRMEIIRGDSRTVRPIILRR